MAKRVPIFSRMHKQLSETLNREKEKKIHHEMTISEKQILVKRLCNLAFDIKERNEAKLMKMFVNNLSLLTTNKVPP